MRVYIHISLCFLYIQFGDSSVLNTSCYRSLRSDYRYSAQVNGWVKLHSMPATWHDARLRCYYEGAVLASPIDENLKQVMIEFMVMDQTMDLYELFTGIHSTFSKGDYTSIEGVPLYKMPVTQWRGTADTPECFILNRDGYLGGSSYSTLHPYMCYKKGPRHLPFSPICGTEDKEYKYEPRTNSCYKFHRIGRTWSRAFMTCLAEGGHLAIINSDVEAQVIKEIFGRFPENDIMAQYKHTASIGFQNWGERGSWWTIHGQDLSEAGFDKWDANSPGSPREQFCGSVNRSGKLNDIWCDGEQNTFPAICEISEVYKPCDE